MGHMKERETKMMDCKVGICILTFCASAMVARVGGCIPTGEDGASLLGFKESLSDPRGSLATWGANFSTNSSSRVAWIEIQCNHVGRVVAINLPALLLHGTISPPLGHLSFLLHLNLSSNNFFGNIPPWLFSNSTSLQVLDLSSNNFTGLIPPQLGILQRLRILYLFRNDFTGGVPSTLANCSAMEEVQFHWNYQLMGEIPSHLGKLQRLRALIFAGNSLKGVIPTTLGNCSHLEDLELQMNQLSGQIPRELGMLQHLIYLVLFRNELDGDIPASLTNCSALQNVQFSENKLSGELPVDLGILKQLQVFKLWGNNVGGEIPTSLTNCSQLLQFSIYRNQVSGGIPEQIGRLASLQSFHVNSNKLTGSLPASLQNCTALQQLVVSGNQLTASEAFLGELFQNLAQLQVLILSSNRLQGNLPDAFDRCTNLTILRLSQNSFTGTLPRSLALLKRLIALDFGNNQFQGPIPSMFSTSLFMQSIDLSFNNLSGCIPDTLGDLPALVSLNLSHNRLIGHVPPLLGKAQLLLSLDLSMNALNGQIPAGLGGCVELKSLNLSCNKLSGNVPASLGNLQSLESLDLSYNQLQGSLPRIPLFQNASISNFSGNPSLCGQILHRACSSTSPVRARSTFKPQFVFIIVAVLVAVLAAIFTILAFLFHKRRCRVSTTVDLKDDSLVREEYMKVTTEELRQATDNFSEENIIGSGSVSVVFRAMLTRQNIAVAVKVLKKEVALSVETRFRGEVQLLAKLRHRNIVRIYGCCLGLEVKAIIMELISNGNLAQHCYGNEIPSSIVDKLRVLKGVAHGLHYLHDLHPDGPFVHCDLKPENILLDADLEPHISDFGIAKLLHGTNNEASSSLLLRGSVGYIPPEYAYNCQVSTEGDVYSFGVIMLELITGQRPTVFSDELEEEESLVSRAQSAYLKNEWNIFKTKPLSEEVTKRAIEVALMCTNHLPSNRPTMHHVVQVLNSLS